MKKKKIPKLRFPGFVGEWEEKRFDEVFVFSTGKNIKQNEASPEFETPCVRYGELYHMYNEVITEVINRTNLHESELTFSDGDEILLPSAGEDPMDIGSASALMIKKVAIGRTINILKPAKENVYSQVFVSYFINHRLKTTISKLAKGASISNVYNSDLKTLSLNLPALPEQAKIASFLRAVDEKIQALKQKESLLQAYKKGLMQKFFSQEIRFKDEQGGDFPAWEEKRLGEVAERKSAKNKENNKNVLTISAQFGLISQLDFFNKSVSAKDLTGYYLLERGDFAYNKSYSNGYPMGAIKCLSRYDKGVVSTLYICFKFNEGVNNSFMEHYFEAGIHNTEIEKIAQEGARNHGLLNVSIGDFFNITILLPSLPEQALIASSLSALDQKLEQVRAQIEQWGLWKRGLLQGLFV